MAIDWTVDRRKLFAGSAAALLGALTVRPFRQASAAQAMFKFRLVSAARIGDADGGVLVSSGSIEGFALPGRAHALGALPDGKVVLIGRRPGKFGAIIDPDDLEQPPRLFAPLPGHRFAGHAAISRDGGTLATSEINAETAEGRVAVRDAGSGAIRNSWPVGIEPHDLLFADDGARLVVAAGGIAYAAEVKGPAMNAGRIESAIVELDTRSGAMLERHTLRASLRSLSLRHMAIAPDGKTIAFGMQDQDRSAARPVMGILRVGQGLDLLPLPQGADAGVLRFYIGSVTIDASGRYIAAASPKGGVVGLWSLSDGRWLGAERITDVCGLAADDEPGSFWASSGHGDLVKLRASETGYVTKAAWQAPLAFDNHLLKL